MKRPVPAALRHNSGSVNARNTEKQLEKQLEKIEKELAWMWAEEEEMMRWIDSLGIDDKYDSRPKNKRVL